MPGMTAMCDRVDDDVCSLTQFDRRVAAPNRRDPIVGDKQVTRIMDTPRVINRDHGAVLNENAAQTSSSQFAQFQQSAHRWH